MSNAQTLVQPPKVKRQKVKKVVKKLDNKSKFILKGQTRFEPTEKDEKYVAALNKKLSKKSTKEESKLLPCQQPWL